MWGHNEKVDICRPEGRLLPGTKFAGALVQNYEKEMSVAETTQSIIICYSNQSRLTQSQSQKSESIGTENDTWLPGHQVGTVVYKGAWGNILGRMDLFSISVLVVDTSLRMLVKTSGIAHWKGWIVLCANFISIHLIPKNVLWMPARYGVNAWKKKK